MTNADLRMHPIIGLTGGIGSGKSTAARRFAELGAYVYSADEIAREALEPGAACYPTVIRFFGNSILAKDGKIDRKALSKIVFSDEKQRTRLNEIVHPYVIGELFSRAKRDIANRDTAVVLFDVPLLFESGLDQRMDRTILVVCDEPERVRRILERDKISPEQALARVHAQMPEEQKRLRADYILDNNGSEKDLLRQVDALYQLLQSEEPRT